MANHRHQTGLDSIATNPPGLPHVPALGPRSPTRSSPDPLGLWSRRQAPGTHHIFAQNHGVVVTGALCRKTDPKIATAPKTQSRSKDQNKDKDNSK